MIANALLASAGLILWALAIGHALVAMFWLGQCWRARAPLKSYLAALAWGFFAIKGRPLP